jgi:hypothetical protein
VGETRIRKKGIMAQRTNAIIAESGNRVFVWPLNCTIVGTCSANQCKTSEYIFIIATLLINNIYRGEHETTRSGSRKKDP